MRSNKSSPILIALLMLVIPAVAFASAVQRFTRDIKPPTQAMLEHQVWASPIVATNNQIKTTVSQSSGVILDVTSFTHQPDYPRNITITPTGTTANNGTCNIVVTGTNFFGVSKTETFANTATNASIITGNKAFATVTDVNFPAACSTGAGVSWIIGVGSKLGLKRCMVDAGRYVFSVFNAAYEATRGTAVGTTAAIESNTFIPNGTMDGTKQVDLYFIQDFSCSP